VTTSSRRDLLRSGVAAILRLGTVVSIGAVAVGYVLTLASDERAASPSLIDLLAGGGGPAVIGIGLLGLTMIPAGVLVVAAIGFWRQGERRRVATALVLLALLLASLGAALIVTPSG
jgi:hypothetical protein